MGSGTYLFRFATATTGLSWDTASRTVGCLWLFPPLPESLLFIQASKFLINLCHSAWMHRLLPPLLPLLPHLRHRHRRTKPATAIFTSVCIKAPLFISVV